MISACVVPTMKCSRSMFHKFNGTNIMAITQLFALYTFFLFTIYYHMLFHSCDICSVNLVLKLKRRKEKKQKRLLYYTVHLYKSIGCFCCIYNVCIYAWSYINIIKPIMNKHIICVRSSFNFDSANCIVFVVKSLSTCTLNLAPLHPGMTENISGTSSTVANSS